eukprot:Opistho-2@35654
MGCRSSRVAHEPGKNVPRGYGEATAGAPLPLQFGFLHHLLQAHPQDNEGATADGRMPGDSDTHHHQHEGGAADQLGVDSTPFVVCPVCDAKLEDSSALDAHLDKCMRRAAIGYNTETLQIDLPGEIECQICLEEFTTGQVVARLGCLCMFHKRCVDGWFRKSRSCPSHPDVWKSIARDPHPG